MPTTANGVSEVVSEESSVLDNQEQVEQQTEQQEPKLTARELKMLEMTQRIREEREAEGGGGDAEPAAQVATPAQHQTPVSTGGPQDSQPKSEGGFEIFVKDGKQHVRLKAYGQVEEIPLELALRRAQKDVAAEKKLRDAIERERRAAHAEESVAQRLKALATQPTMSTPAQPADDVDLEQTLEKLYQGDIKSAAAELNKVILKGRHQATPQVSSEVIAAQVEHRLQQNAAAKAQAKYDADLVHAAGVYEEEFPDLAQDTRLSAYFDRETELLMAQHPEKALVEVVREAAQTIRKLTQPAPQQSNARLEMKRAAPKHITSARVASVSTNIEPAPPPRTPSSVIADMRKSRGQAPR